MCEYTCFPEECNINLIKRLNFQPDHVLTSDYHVTIITCGELIDNPLIKI